MKVNAKLLREKLAEYGYTLESFAEAINVPLEIIQKMISGQMSPSHYLVSKVNTLLKLSCVEHMQIFSLINLT